MIRIALAALAVSMMFVLAGPASAKDTKPCAPGLICASDPATIVAALQKAGYKAKLTTDDTGDPEIESAASGYNFQILFYDCADHKQCAAIQFYSSFTTDPSYTPAFVNKWNIDKRFLRAYLSEKKSLVFDHDVTTIGGVTQDNFADLLDWMDVSLSAVNTYLNPPSAKK